MTFGYETIFSRSRLKMNDLKEIMSLSETDMGNIFSSISLDDDIQEITFDLKNGCGSDLLNKEYVVELLSLGMVITWLRPQVESFEYTTMTLGGKEEKLLVNNYKPVIARLDSLELKLHQMIRDHGYIYNSYLTEDQS